MSQRHSFSALKMFENCPLRYYHQRIAKTVQDQGSEATHYGTRVHEALELTLRNDRPLPEDLEHLQDVVASVRKLAKGGKFQTEQPLALDTNLEPTYSWMEGKTWIQSILDVVIVYPQTSKAIVIDWKTGKRRPDPTQLQLFALQVFAHYPRVNTVRTAYVWIADGTMDKATYRRADKAALWAPLLERIARVDEAIKHDVWPARPSGLCRYCPCFNSCEFAQRR